MEIHAKAVALYCQPDASRRTCLKMRAALAVIVTAACLAMPLCGANAADKQVARGKYLVSLGGCNDCHTPGYFLGKPDMTKYLAGSDVGFAIPGLGVFVGPNLTPDKQTGLGNFTMQQIVTALTKGQLPDGRILAPIMPWKAFANMTKSDALAIAAFLKSLPAVNHQVPGPFGPTQTPTVFVMSVQPANVYAGLPKPGAPPAAAAPIRARRLPTRP
jgi:mono/diheme cytochrome c family protein